MQNRIATINLLKSKDKNFWNRFIGWALTFGRVVVIVTEMIAISAFLYRFFLDRELIDLHDQIKQKEAIVRLSKKNEDAFRNLQERLASTQSLKDNAAETAQIIIDITDLAPPNITFNTITLSGDNLRIEANIQSVSTLTDFVNKLKAYNRIQRVSLDNIENKATNAQIVVGISAFIK